MNTCNNLSVVIFSSICFTANAQVPFEFTDQTAANAQEVNANFTTLVNQINQLQARVFALETYAGEPTTSTLAGTYDIIDLTVDVEQNNGGFGVAGKSSTGTVTLNADGTGNVSVSDSYRQLSFVFNQIDVQGTPVNSTSVQFNSSPESEDFPITWSHSDGIVTFTIGQDEESLIVAGGRLLISAIKDFEGQNGLRILIKQ